MDYYDVTPEHCWRFLLAEGYVTREELELYRSSHEAREEFARLVEEVLDELRN